MTSVLFAFADSIQEWNCSQWRCKIPSDSINKMGKGHKAKLMPISDFIQYGHPVIQEIIGEYDTIIVQRNVFIPEVWAACDYWRALDRLVCADLDDDYPRLTPQNPAYNFWIRDVGKVEEKHGLPPIKALTEGLKHVDALFSPNKLILEDWNDVVDGYFVANFAFAPWYEKVEPKPTPTEEEPIIIGWGGSVSHFDSWWFSGMMEAALTVMEKYPRVHFKICGNDWRLLSALEEKWPQERWTHQGGVPPEQWPYIVSTFDVGLAPLCGPGAPQSEEYDNRRSWLKAVEYLLCGVPWLGSPGPVYKDLHKRGGFCVAENTPDVWYEAISEMVDQLPAYKAKSKNLVSWARESLTMQGQTEAFVAQIERLKSLKNARRKMRLPNVIYVADLIQQENNGTKT